jgi:hypothetical protein
LLNPLDNLLEASDAPALPCQRDSDAHDRPRPGSARDDERSAERLDALRARGQTDVTFTQCLPPPGLVESAAVVTYFKYQ